MIHVLIVVSWLGGAVQGATISTQEFSSAERCEAARLALIEYAKARSIEETLRPVCTQKGESARRLKAHHRFSISLAPSILPRDAGCTEFAAGAS